MKIEEIRKEIDEIDKKIIELLGNRNELIRKIAKIKKEEKIAIDDSEREKEIIKKIFEKSELEGLDKEFIKKIYELILEDSKNQQKEYF